MPSYEKGCWHRSSLVTVPVSAGQVKADVKLLYAVHGISLGFALRGWWLYLQGGLYAGMGSLPDLAGCVCNSGLEVVMPILRR